LIFSTRAIPCIQFVQLFALQEFLDAVVHSKRPQDACLGIIGSELVDKIKFDTLSSTGGTCQVTPVHSLTTINKDAVMVKEKYSTGLHGSHLWWRQCLDVGNCLPTLPHFIWGQNLIMLTGKEHYSGSRSWGTVLRDSNFWGKVGAVLTKA
jgi:hypothetical protein